MVDPDANMPPSTVASQAQWCGVGYTSDQGAHMNNMLEDTLKQPQVSAMNGRNGTRVKSPKNSADGLPDTAIEEGSNDDTSYPEQENSHIQPVFPAHPLMPEYFIPHTQLELGQTITCAPYPYSDPYYGNMIAGYGPQPLVHSPFIGTSQTRMVLPLEMTEEPVYVNAKQYHGILRRRQSRAKAELEKKLIKDRKPYLHESRHKHAMRRARGCGGRFLNTKKGGDANGSNPLPKRPGGSNVGNPMHPTSFSGSDNTPDDDAMGTSDPNIKNSQECSGEHSNNQSHTHANNHNGGSFQQHTSFPFNIGDCSGPQKQNGILAKSCQTVTIQ